MAARTIHRALPSTPPSEFIPPSYQDIAQRAYTRYESRGASDGHDLEDWLEAERELRDRLTDPDAAGGWSSEDE